MYGLMDINHALICPVNAIPLHHIGGVAKMVNVFPCPCIEYSKDGLCDYPFKNGLTLEQIKKLREGYGRKSL